MEKQDDSYGMRETTGYLLISHPAFPSAQLYGASDFIFPYEPSKQWDYRQAGTRVAVEDWLIKAVSHIHDSRNLSLELIPEVW